MYFYELGKQYTTKSWYFLLSGIVFLLFGLFVILFPQTTERLVVAIFGVGQIVDAVVLLTPVVLGRTTRHLWKVTVTKGVLELVVGIVALLFEATVIHIFAVVVGGLLVMRGILELITVVETQARVSHRRWSMLMATFLILVGIMIMLHPIANASTFAFIIGLYAIGKGLTMIVLSSRLHQMIEHALEESTLASRLLEAAPIVSDIDEKIGILDADDEINPDNTVERRTGLLGLDLSRYQRPMVIAPHPDDLEGFAAGVMALTPGVGVSVVMAGGNLGIWDNQFKDMPTEDYIHFRLEESAEAARLLGVAEVVYMGYKDREVTNDDEAVDKVLRQIDKFEPDLVISFEYHKWLNPYRHPDHLATAAIARKAIARYARRDHIDYLVTSTLFPNRFVDVTGIRRVKLEALACHTTQTTLNAAIFPFLEKLLTTVWGLFIGSNYAEGYREVDIPKMVKRLKK